VGDIASNAACRAMNGTGMRSRLRVTDIRHPANIHIDCRWGIFGYFAKTRTGNRSAWFTGAGSSNAFQPDERDHCRVLYWFSLSFIAGCTRLLSVASGNRAIAD
jgi:hypothetical protein